MADIELVIKIPEELKNKIDNANEDNYRTYLWWFETTLYCAIKDGTPLPKGHGRLKDADAICKDIISALGIRDENYLLEAEEAVYKRIKNAPTIIEADKAESENKE